MKMIVMFVACLGIGFLLAYAVMIVPVQMQQDQIIEQNNFMRENCICSSVDAVGVGGVVLNHSTEDTLPHPQQIEPDINWEID